MTIDIGSTLRASPIRAVIYGADGVGKSTWSDVFSTRFRVANECWEWAGVVLNTGYGQVNLAGKRRESAHRLSYALHFGPFDAAMCVCHRCDNPPCIRPEHLFLGTHADNAADRNAKGRQARGERSRMSSLKEGDVAQIRTMPGTHRAIGAIFGISHAMVGYIKRGKCWR